MVPSLKMEVPECGWDCPTEPVRQAHEADTWAMGTPGAEILLRFHATASGCSQFKVTVNDFGEPLNRSDHPYHYHLCIYHALEHFLF